MKELNKAQKKRLRDHLKNKTIDPQAELITLISEGFEPDDAVVALKKELKAIADEEDGKWIGFLVAFIMGVGLSIFGVTNLSWYLLCAIIVAGVAFWGDKEQPIAAITSSVFAVIMVPLATTWYLTGRSSFINLELIIPAVLVGIPTFGIYKLIEKINNR